MKRALIIGDLQRGITTGFPFAKQVIEPLRELLPRARAAGVLVVFVHIAFRPNRADLPPNNTLFASFFEAREVFHEGMAGTEIDPDLSVQAEDVVVLKRRASAFAGTDLDLVLRARGVDTIAVAGVATGAMVAATCYDGGDRGYPITVLRDGCADSDQAMHDFFMDKVFPSRGHDVVSCAKWLQSSDDMSNVDKPDNDDATMIDRVVAALRDGKTAQVGGGRSFSTYVIRDGQPMKITSDDGYTEDIPLTEERLRELIAMDSALFLDYLRHWKR